MKKVVACILAVGLSTAAFADPVVWDNGAANGGGGFSSQQDNAYPFHSQTADDFRLPLNQDGDPFAPTLITDVHWQGVWFNPGPPGNATAFNINFYADAGGQPTGAGAADPTPTALASYTFPAGAVNETPNAVIPGVFDYYVDLPNGFLAQKDVTYWIGIQSVNTFPPQWGWSTSAITQGFDAKQGFPLLQINYWADPSPGALVDMAYQLTGHKIPEPGSLALLSLGALAMLRRR